MKQFIESFVSLKLYCEKEQFMGWDPYDGLNSKIFQALPFFKKSALCCLIVIQGFKWNPVNLRKIAMVLNNYSIPTLQECCLSILLKEEDELVKYL